MKASNKTWKSTTLRNEARPCPRDMPPERMLGLKSDQARALQPRALAGPATERTLPSFYWHLLGRNRLRKTLPGACFDLRTSHTHRSSFANYAIGMVIWLVLMSSIDTAPRILINTVSVWLQSGFYVYELSKKCPGIAWRCRTHRPLPMNKHLECSWTHCSHVSRPLPFIKSISKCIPSAREINKTGEISPPCLTNFSPYQSTILYLSSDKLQAYKFNISTDPNS